MKSFLATTAIVLLMGGSAYAAPAKLDAYQAQASDIDASKFIGQTVYASKTDVSSDQKVTGAGKDWDNIGDINEVVIGRDGMVKAVVIGVGGFLGMGEKNVAVSMNDINFVRDGDRPNDFFLVVNSTKEALNTAPAFKTPDEIRDAQNTPAATDTTTTAANPGLTAPADTASNTATTNDMSKTNDMAKTDDASKSSTMTDESAANTTMQPADSSATNADKTTTASTTNSDTNVQSTMNDNRTHLTPPTVTRDGYATAKVEELTADKLQGATVYGPKDEDVGKINRLVMNDNGNGIKLFVLDIGGFLGIGAHQIAVTPQELNIVRDAKGDDIRVYIDANKQALKAQPEYKMQ